jgi:hypothetical protein
MNGCAFSGLMGKKPEVRRYDMNQHVIRSLSVGIAILLLTGCVAFQTTTTIQPDGSGTNEINIGFTKMLLEALEEDDPFGGIQQETDETLQKWQASIEPWETDVYKGVRITLQFTDLAMLEEQLNTLLGPDAEGGMFDRFVVRQDGSQILISTKLVQEGMREEDIDPEMRYLLEGFKLTWTVELPNLEGYSEEAIATRDGNRLTWEFPLSEETKTYNLEVRGMIDESVPIPTPTLQPTTTLPGERCFSEVPYCINGRAREFWEENGGLTVFGFPTSAQKEEIIEGKAYQVQTFERNRMELHPEKPRPYDVLLGRLGVEMLEQQGRDWWQFPMGFDQGECLYFQQTRHSVCGTFLATWYAHGLEIDGKPGFSTQDSLALFGYPISEPMPETLHDGQEYTVQYFERVRMEYHPENTEPFTMLFGLLGKEVR